MDFDFSFEQTLIAKSVRGTLEALPPVMDRAPYPYEASEIARKLADLGLFGAGDGPALGFADAVAVAMEVGRALPAAPVVEQLAALFGLAATRSDLAEALGQGQIVTVAVSGAFALSPDGVSGRVLVPFANDAVAVLAPVATATGPQWHVFALDRLALAPAETTDVTVAASFATARGIDVATVLPAGAVALDDILILLVMAEVTGAAEIALEKSVAYARERKQFGKPVGSNQAVKHIAADAAVSVEIMKAAVEHAGWTCDQAAAGEAGADDVAMALAAARSFVGEHARLVVERATQMHGGIAFTWDFGLHRYLRRVLYRTNTLIRPLESRAFIAARVLAQDCSRESETEPLWRN